MGKIGKGVSRSLRIIVTERAGGLPRYEEARRYNILRIKREERYGGGEVNRGLGARKSSKNGSSTIVIMERAGGISPHP